MNRHFNRNTVMKSSFAVDDIGYHPTGGTATDNKDNIVELARKPGLSIVAEGVETQEQADLMIGKGVHFLQGYLYSPPVPGNKFISEWVMKAGG